MPEASELFIRNRMLYGEQGHETLQKSFVAVVGLGGVGSYAAESLVRAGIGKLRVIDCDIITPSDVNRQLIALATNVGTAKVEAAKERYKQINPHVLIDSRFDFFHREKKDDLITKDLDYVVDAIDSLNPKIELISHCLNNEIPLISSMGASGRTNPLDIRIDTLRQTKLCPLARIVRRYIRRRNISPDFPVVYSIEPLHEVAELTDAETLHEKSDFYKRGRKRNILPSQPALPAIFGLIAANYVIMSLLGLSKEKK